MSILRSVIRATAVAALREQTWAGELCYDSDNSPLAAALLKVGDTKPYITVYTDTDDHPRLNGNELYDGDKRAMTLAVEIGVASVIRGPSKSGVDGTGPLMIKFSQTDQGMEWAVDAVEAQVFAALFGSPRSKWGELFKQLTYKLMNVTSRRGGQADKGTRWAARRIVFTFSTIWDIPPGVLLDETHPIMKFVAMAQTYGIDVKVDQLASLVQLLLRPGAAEANSWREAQAYLGKSADQTLALVPDGSPLPAGDWIEMPPKDPMDETEVTPTLTEVRLEDADAADGSDVTTIRDVDG